VDISLSALTIDPMPGSIRLPSWRHSLRSIAGVAALCLCLQFSVSNAADKQQPKAAPAQPLHLPAEINDQRMETQLDEAAERLLKSGTTVKMSELLKQAQRRTVSLSLPKVVHPSTNAVDLIARARAGVLVVGDLYKCKKCPRWHVGVSSGFMLTANGVCATCFHVINVPASPTLIAMTGDGRVVAVREVLAANPNLDLAILRLDGSGFTPLPADFEPITPPGASVNVLSHPDDHFFTLTSGMVSRYVTIPLDPPAGAVTMMAITADFGAGSSGAPVINERGGVIGMVNNTQSLYYDPKRGRDLQMVFKHCLPVQYLRELIKANDKPQMTDGR
jgi:S1-C subfamily serine protease